MNKYKVLGIFLCAIMLFSACSAERNETAAAESPAMDYGVSNDTAMPPPDMAVSAPQAAMDDDAKYYGEMSVPEEANDTGTTGFSAETPAGKIIRTASVQLQSEFFDDTMGALRAAALDNGGYVENASLYTQYGDTGRPGGDLRFFDITLRVPSEHFDTVIKQVEGLGHVVSSHQSAQDATASYYDAADRLETKKIEEERVLDMITRAEKIEDLLALEERLGQIRTQIEQYQNQMTSIDRLSMYATITVSLEEVTKAELAITTSDGLGGRVQQAFVNSVNAAVAFLQDAVIFLAGIIVPLALMALLVLIGVRIALRMRKKKAE